MLVNHAGNFRVHVADYKLIESTKSGAVGVWIVCDILAEHDEEGWHDCEVGLTCAGTTWIIKKDGNLNNNACQSLMTACGWDGSLSQIASKQWAPTNCQVQVGADEYGGQVRYRIEFVNAWDRKPQAAGEVLLSRAVDLEAKYGSRLASLASQNPQVTAPPVMPSASDPSDIPF